MNRFPYTTKTLKEITSYTKVPPRQELFGDHEVGAVKITDVCNLFLWGWGGGTLNRGMPQTPKRDHNHSLIEALALRNLLVRTIL